MNAFRLAGDIIHALGILVLLLKIAKTKSCSGISCVSQILYLITFICRYQDLGFFISYYNTTMKCLFISATAFTVFPMFLIQGHIYNREYESKWMFLLLLPTATLAWIVCYVSPMMEVVWAFSQYLEAVAMLPQFAMIFKMGRAEVTVLCYMAMLAVYRLLYICNWIYRYQYEGYLDSTSLLSGSLQSGLYLMFFFVFYTADKSAVPGTELGDAAEQGALPAKSAVPDTELGDATEQGALPANDDHLSHKDTFIYVRGLTPYYEKFACFFNQLRLVIHRECSGLFCSNRADDALKSASGAPVKEKGVLPDSESVVEKPVRATTGEIVL